MRWLPSRRAEDPIDTELVGDSAAEPVPTVNVQDETEVAERGADAGESDRDGQPLRAGRRIQLTNAIAYGLLPGLALLLASAAGYLKWEDGSVRQAQEAHPASVQAAIDGTV